MKNTLLTEITITVTRLVKIMIFLTWRLLKFLEQELEWFFRSANNQLLEKVLEEFKDLELLKLIFNALHIVEFLEFVHFLLGFL